MRKGSIKINPLMKVLRASICSDTTETVVKYLTVPYIIQKITGGFTMQSKDLSAVLDMAIDKEIEAHAFYLDLHGRVTDPEAKQTLQFLASEEKKHRGVFGQVQRGCSWPAIVEKFSGHRLQNS